MAPSPQHWWLTGKLTRRRFATQSNLPLEGQRSAPALPHRRFLAQPHQPLNRESLLYRGVRCSASPAAASFGGGGKARNTSQFDQTRFLESVLDATPPTARCL